MRQLVLAFLFISSANMFAQKTPEVMTFTGVMSMKIDNKKHLITYGVISNLGSLHQEHINKVDYVSDDNITVVTPDRTFCINYGKCIIVSDRRAGKPFAIKRLK